jgi:hypothetical protein
MQRQWLNSSILGFFTGFWMFLLTCVLILWHVSPKFFSNFTPSIKFDYCIANVNLSIIKCSTTIQSLSSKALIVISLLLLIIVTPSSIHFSSFISLQFNVFCWIDYWNHVHESQFVYFTGHGSFNDVHIFFF